MSPDLSTLPRHLRGAARDHLAGMDLREAMPRSTWYRIRTALLPFGIDLARSADAGALQLANLVLEAQAMALRASGVASLATWQDLRAFSFYLGESTHQLLLVRLHEAGSIQADLKDVQAAREWLAEVSQ